MKILQVVPFFPPAYGFGGLAEIPYQISKALVKSGHEVVVYTSDAKDGRSRLNVRPVENLNGIEVHYFRNTSFIPIRNLFITPKLIPLCKRNIRDFDIIHLHGYWTFQNIVLHHYAKKYDIPYILQAHGSLPIGYELQGMKKVFDLLFGTRILEDASKMIAVSNMEVKHYTGRNVAPEKIVNIPNGVDPSRLKAMKGAFRKRYSISKDTRIILFLGRLHHIKGVDILIEAYVQLLNEFKDTLLVIVGPDDGFLSSLKRKVRSHNLMNRILFTGLLYEERKFEAYRDADLFVLPSRYEIFGIVILEAYAFSLPVVASNIPSLSELIQDGRTGYLFESGQVSSLVEKIRTVLQNPEKSKNMGLEGFKLLNQRFTIDRIADSMETLYLEFQH